MTKSKGSKKIRKEYLNDECESVCSEDSINYFLNPPMPKGKKYSKKDGKKYQKKSEDNTKTIKQLKYDKKKDFETIKKKIQQKNKSDPLKLYCGDDMYSFDGLDSDIMEQVISDRPSDDDTLDEEEILNGIINGEDIDDEPQPNKMDVNLDIAIDEQPVLSTVKQQNYEHNDNDKHNILTEEDSEYEINEIIKWKNSEDLMVGNVVQGGGEGVRNEELKERDHLEDNEVNEDEDTFTNRSFHINQRISGEEIAMIESTAEIDTQNVNTYVLEVQEEMVPTYQEGYYEIDNNIAQREGEDNDEKCKKDEEEKERDSEDKGDEKSLAEEVEETEDGNYNELQNRIQFLSETIAKLKAELAEAKEAVEEEKKATKIPGHVCNMSEPCTVASQLEERLRVRRNAAAATYHEELQQVERMVSQEISRLEEDMSKLKPLNKLAADWELPRDAHLRSIMYRHDYMLVASDLTLNIPQELKSFFSTELKEIKNPPALL